MGQEEIKTLPDVFGAIWCLLGVASQIFLGRRLNIPSRLNYSLAISLAVISYFTEEKHARWLWPHHRAAFERDWIGGIIFAWWVAAMGAAVICICFLVFNRKAKANPERRLFLQASAAAVCAAPGIVLATGMITRKDFHIKEVDISFPNLPKDLQGLRLLQLSDIHLGPFFSANDLRRVVDASNNLKPDLAFITGDLITHQYDPLDQCLLELQRLRSHSGIWGCMGNHELYAGVQNYTQTKARQLGIEFLRQQARLLQFGNSRLNLVGVDYKPWENLHNTDDLVALDSFNLLLAHTPEIFKTAAEKGFDLTLSGHTHGGQINLDLFGANINIVDVRMPYTKGLYTLPTSSIYVNSGLGTIGLPVRIGAPPEITLIRLCKS